MAPGRILCDRREEATVRREARIAEVPRRIVIDDLRHTVRAVAAIRHHLAGHPVEDELVLEEFDSRAGRLRQPIRRFRQNLGRRHGRGSFDHGHDKKHDHERRHRDCGAAPRSTAPAAGRRGGLAQPGRAARRGGHDGLFDSSLQGGGTGAGMASARRAASITVRRFSNRAAHPAQDAACARTSSAASPSTRACTWASSRHFMTISCNVRMSDGGRGCPLPAVHGASQQAAHGRPAYRGCSRDLAIRQPLRSERQEQPIARRELPQGIARRPEPAILVPQWCGFHGWLVRWSPRQPPEPASHAVPGRIRRDREQPAVEVRSVAPGLEMRQELQERLLHHVLRIVAMPP